MREYNIEKEKKFWNSLARGYEGFVKRIDSKTYNHLFAHLKDDGKIILPTYLHGANLQSKILSRLMGISGFQARNRWSVVNFREFVTRNGFHISKEKDVKDNHFSYKGIRYMNLIESPTNDNFM